MIVGIDDTDAIYGMCTTYLAAVLFDKLRKYGEMGPYPLLIRLNPNVSYKTRGNASVAIPIHTDKEDDIRETVIQTVDEFSMLEDENTDPGVVFVDSTTKLKNFSDKAMKQIIPIGDAKRIISELGIEYYAPKKGRGLIGALAAVGSVEILEKDCTYELIAYRHKERWGTSREIDEGSVWEADKQTYPLTWDNVDYANKKITLAPHSPCPLLYGIRGDDVDAIIHAANLIKSEPIERSMIFKTNQGTDLHLMDANEIKDGRSYALNGLVSSKPTEIKGGHVFFSLGEITCAAYEPTKGFRNIIRKLEVGDEVFAYGSINNGTMNLEKIEIKSLADKYMNPTCPVCGKRMESIGKGKGYRCKKCRTFAREKVLAPRNIETGLYEVPPVARRHIAKPLIRFSSLKTHPSR